MPDQSAAPPRLQDIVDRIVSDVMGDDAWGRATETIAPLTEIDTRQFGIAILMRDGEVITGGAAATPFSIQSISKVFSLKLALDAYGDEVWQRVGREPSGDPFNSIIDLERLRGFPRNPFINAGALVVVDMLVDHYGEGKETEAVIGFVADMLGEDQFGINEEVATSHHQGAYLNRSLASLAKHFGNLHSDIERVLEAFSRQCAIELSCVQLAKAGRFLMLGDYNEGSRAEALAARQARRTCALMMTCGMYDGSGDFAYRVGLPAKSGVGGGILAIVPNTATIAVWSPGLDDNGNSLMGTLALEKLTDEIEWSVFGAIRTEVGQ